jgi:hypothetical protein
MLSLDQLCNLKRMGVLSPPSHHNNVKGLIDLIKDINIEDKVIAEIGCWIGVSTQTFLHFKPSKLYAIDCWNLNNDPKDELLTNLLYLTHANNAEAQFRHIMLEYNNVEIIKEFSVEAASKIPDRSLYFCYIDACHSYQNVLEDIKAWLPKVQNNGFIGGHDIFIENVAFALRDSIRTLPRLKNKTFTTYSDTSWLINLS